MVKVLTDGNGKVYFTQSGSALLGNDMSDDTVVATGSTEPRTLANRFADIINVKDFGAVGDGVTDDTAAIQAAMNHASKDDTIFFPNGTYKVTTITPPTRLHLTGGHIKSNTVGITITSSEKGGSIKNMTIEAPIGILVEGYVRNLLVENCIIEGANTYGIWIKQGNEFMFKNSLIHLPNNYETTGTGIKIDTWDCHFSNIIIQGYKTAVECTRGANIFDKIHAWFNTQDLYIGSSFMKIRGQNQISNCYSDGYQYVFNLYDNYYKLDISNILINVGHDTTDNNPIIFYSSKNTQNMIDGSNEISCSGLEWATTSKQVYFSNIENFCIDGYYERNGYLGKFVYNKPNGDSKNSNYITCIPKNLTNVYGTDTSTIWISGSSYTASGEEKKTSQNLSKDLSTLTNGTYLILSEAMSSLDFVPANQSFSGSTQPTPTNSRAIWYDTENEQIKITYDSGLTWEGNMCLPLVKLTITDGKISKIDKIYNGFSEIGSYLFLIPGLSGYEAYGFNNDGSKKNKVFFIEKLEKINSGGYSNIFNVSQYNDLFYLTVRSSNIYTNVKDKEEMYNIGMVGVYYVENENMVYSYGGTGYTPYTTGCTIGTGIRANEILDFKFETDTFYSGKRLNYLASISKPSSSYQTLTLGASGAQYTMQKSGTLILGMTSSTAGEFIKLQNSTSGLQEIVISQDAGIYYTALLPVSLGDKVTVYYTMPSLQYGPFKLIFTKGDALCL